MQTWDTRPIIPPSGVAPTAAGVGPSELTRAQLRGKGWRVSSRGLYVPRDVEMTPSQQIAEAAARLPGSGAVGGWAAAYWMGVGYLNGIRGGRPGEVLLCVGDLGKIRPSPGVIVCRARLTPDDVVEVRGLRVTTPVRTAFDGARLAGSLTEAVIFVDMMLAAGLVTEGELASYLVEHRPAWKGVEQARNALRLADRATRSPQETRLRMLWMINAGLPRPLVNQSIFGWDGRLVAIADVLDPDAGTVGEYDGEQHRELAQHTSDNAREEALEEMGLVVTRVTALDFASREATASRLQRAWLRGEERDRSKDRWTIVPPAHYRRRPPDPIQNREGKELNGWFGADRPSHSVPYHPGFGPTVRAWATVSDWANGSVVDQGGGG